MDDSVLIEIRDALLRIEARLPERKAKRLSPTDETALLGLLPVIARAIEGHPFTIKQLAKNATFGVAPSVALRGALVSTTPLRLGRLLDRAAGFEVGGYHVRKVRSTRDGVLWRVLCDDESSQTLARLAPPRRVRF